MMTGVVRALTGLVVVLIVAAIGVFAFAFWPTETKAIAPIAAADESSLVEKGRYLAVAGDCAACHTDRGGKPFAGGLPIASPLGTIYASNITPDRQTGIGAYTLDDFGRVLRHGITPKGTTLYPAMPYPSYALLTDDDVRALYAYFTKAVEPVNAANKAVDIPWPLSMRWPLAIWRKTFGPGSAALPFDTAKYPDPVVARGAYLVQGPGHCGACHTARALTLQEVALDDSSADYLAGGQVIDGWFAVNLRGNEADGLGRASIDDIVAELRSGRDAHHAVVGSPMQDVVVQSLQNLTDGDLRAIATYLKSLPASKGDTAGFAPDTTTAAALAAGADLGPGANLFVDNCAACHRTSGLGEPGAFPAMPGNPTVLAKEAASLIRLVLAGARLPSTKTAPSRLGMPGFGWRMTDAQVAELVTFIRQSWGNQASAVSAADVAKVRKVLQEEQATPREQDRTASTN